MTKSEREVWQEGFRAGQVVVERCHYPADSSEARVWHNGYGLGLFKGEGGRRDEVAPARATGRWWAWLHGIIGH